MSDWPIIGKRLESAEGVEVKYGDLVTYEVIYPDGEMGTFSYIHDKFWEEPKQPAPSITVDIMYENGQQQ